MNISVIVSTFNRKESLERCISSLSRQSFDPQKYEIIISDDGSTDGTESIVAQLQPPCPLVYERHENRGAAFTRNAGLSRARGQAVLFLDDDMEATNDLLQGHWKYHQRNDNCVVLGLKRIPEQFASSRFLRFVDFGGVQQAYPKQEGRIEDSRRYRYFHTGNISVTTEAFRRIGGFDSSVFTRSDYGNEDVEAGYRLVTKENSTFYYNPHALTYHYYNPTLEQYCRRMHASGWSAFKCFEKHPAMVRDMQIDRVLPLRSAGHSASRVIGNIVSKMLVQRQFVNKLLEALLPLAESTLPDPLLFLWYRSILHYHKCRGISEALTSKGVQE